MNPGTLHSYTRANRINSFVVRFHGNFSTFAGYAYLGRHVVALMHSLLGLRA